MNLSTHKPPSHADCVETGTGDTSVTFHPEILKRFKLKADFILLPMLTFAYLLKYVLCLFIPSPPTIERQRMLNPYTSSLDRSNLSNAYTAGLSADLGLTGNQYNQILTYYQIPFIVLGPLVTMLTKRLGARWTIPGMLLIFGAASLASGFVKDFESMVVCRVFVGAFEAGFLASCVRHSLKIYKMSCLTVFTGFYTICRFGTHARN